jgi:hypothetical protein
MRPDIRASHLQSIHQEAPMCHSGTDSEDVMENWHFIYLLAAATGLVSAGLAGSSWALVTGNPPRLSLLYRVDFLTPLKVLALCIHAPLGAVRLGMWYLEFNPFVAIPLLMLGLGWSFLQGVLILTTFFGYS